MAVWAVCFFLDFFGVLELLAVCLCAHTCINTHASTQVEGNTHVHVQNFQNNENNTMSYIVYMYIYVHVSGRFTNMCNNW